MSRTQRIVVAVLVIAVLLVCCVLTGVVSRDLTDPEQPWLDDPTMPTIAPPTAPPVLPTDDTLTRATRVPAASSAADAISFVRNFRYDPAQGKSLEELIGTLQIASRKFGTDIGAQAWTAEREQDDRWVVTYGYRAADGVETYAFLVDLRTDYITARDEEGDTVLSFLQQDAQVKDVSATATPVTIFVGWAVRDHFTKWEYHVPGEPQHLTVLADGQEPFANDAGFLMIPLVLHNLDKVTKTLRTTYYTRFALRDSAGQLAALVDRDNFRLPTQTYCRARRLPEWTAKNVDVAPDATVTSALVFRLLPDTRPPYTLEITVYELHSPHRYDIRLTGE